MFSFITSREYSTSTPRNFNRGFLIYPPRTSQESPAAPVPIGREIREREIFGGRLLDVRIPVGQWRFAPQINSSFFMGAFFGFNMQYLVGGATSSDGTGYIGISNDVIEGGMAMGVSFTFSGTFRLQEAGREYRGNNSWVRGWVDSVNREFGPINIDLLQIAIAILSGVWGDPLPNALTESFRRVGSVGALYGFFGESRNQFQRTGRAQLRPQFHLRANILTIVPEMRAVLAAFRKVGLTVSIGPLFNFLFPIDFEVVRVETDAGVYRVSGSNARNRGILDLEGGPRGNFPPTNSLVVVHSHTTSFEFTVDLNVQISLLGIFRVDESTPIGYDHRQFAVGIPNLIGPFFTALRGAGPTAAHLEIPEVEWA